MKVRRDSKEEAICVRDELAILWLLTLPWRQRNLRECRLTTNPVEGNLFKAERPTFVHLALTPHIEDCVRVDSKFRFWQFYFRPVETKIGHAVRGIVPRQLVALLDKYVECYRPALVSNFDPGTLFLTEDGDPFTQSDFGRLISDLTLRHVGRRVNPHLFRDIFAYKWLDDHPEDYLTVSKILWHRSLNYTLRVYGRNFDESNAAVRTEAWLDRLVLK